MDRAIVIWRIPPTPKNHIAKEYKPLFSNAIMHKARVLSVSWLSEDLLLTHSSATFIRHKEYRDKKQNIPGSIILFQWDGLPSYFPPEHRDNIPYPMYGIAGDTNNSSSYRILSRYKLPLLDETIHDFARQRQYSQQLTVFRSPTQDPILAYASGNTVYVMNVSQFQPNPPPTRNNPFIDTQGGGGSEESDIIHRPHEHNLDEAAWRLVIDNKREVLWGCCMAMDGRLVLGAGSGLYAWALR
jgi:hypothetical protein